MSILLSRSIVFFDRSHHGRKKKEELIRQAPCSQKANGRPRSATKSVCAEKEPQAKQHRTQAHVDDPTMRASHTEKQTKSKCT